jgi:hypothetical protein
MRTAFLAAFFVACLAGPLAVPAHGQPDRVVNDGATESTPSACSSSPDNMSIDQAVTDASAGNTILVCPGTYNETVTVGKSVILEGPNAGTDGNGSRIDEATVNGGDGIAIEIATTDAVTVDGFQFEGDRGVVRSGGGSLHDQITIRNNRFRTDEYGARLRNIETGGNGGGISVSDNFVDLTAQVYTKNGSEAGTAGIALRTVDGSGDVIVSGNDFQDGGDAGDGAAWYGVVFDGVDVSSGDAVITGGSSGAAMQGLAQAVAILDGEAGEPLVNTSGSQTPDASDFAVQGGSGGLSASSFTGESSNGSISFHAGVFVYTGGSPGTKVETTGSITNITVTDPGTANETGNSSAGLYFGGFSTEFGSNNGGSFDQTVTVTNVTVEESDNRGIYARGADVTAEVTQSTIAGNGDDAPITNNPGLGVVARKGANLNVTESTITNPSSLDGGTFGSALQSQQTLTVDGTNYPPVLTITRCKIDRNGSTAGIFSGNNEVRAARSAFVDGGTPLTGSEIASSADGSQNDFNPYLTSTSDADGGTPGFQADLSGVTVTTAGDQLQAFGDDQRIADGISAVNADGTVTVESGTYTENVAVNKSVTLEGAKAGIPGSDGSRRSDESVVKGGTASLAAAAFSIGAEDVTIDGFQMTGNQGVLLRNGSVSSTGDGLAVQNNLVQTNITGVTVEKLNTSSPVVISNNQFEIQQQEFVDPSNNGSEAGDQVGEETAAVSISELTGDVAPTLSGNVITDDGDDDQNGVGDPNPSGRDDGAFYGYILRGAKVSGGPVTISGGSISGTLQGIAVLDGQIVQPSDFRIENVTMDGFAGVANNAAVNFHAGVFVYSAGSPGSGNEITTTGTITGVVVEETEVPATANDPGGFEPSAGIYFGGFSDQFGDGTAKQDVTLTKSTIRNNANRGVFARGKETTATVTQTTIEDNGGDPHPDNSPPAGIGVLARRGATLEVQNSFVTNPPSGNQAGSSTVDALQSVQKTEKDGTEPIIEITDSKIDRNGNGQLLTGGGSGNGDLSAEQNVWQNGGTVLTNGSQIVGPNDGDYFGGGDFTPFLTNATDQDTEADGFQPDNTQLGVTNAGDQRESVGRLQEGTNVADVNGGTASVDPGTYDVTDLEVKGNLVLESGAEVTLGGLLTLSSGTFDVTGGTLTLESAAENSTAAIAGSGSGSVDGNVTFERTLTKSDDASHFRMLTAPTGAAVDGSGDAPLLSNTWTQSPSGQGADASAEASVFTYDEAADLDDSNPDLSQGWTGIGTAGSARELDDPVAAGEGVLAYLFTDRDFDGNDEGFPRTLSATGPVRGAENDGNPVTPSITFTGGDGDGTTNNGWNLIANPFMAPIDWESIENDGSGLSSVDATIYVYDAESGQYTTYTADPNGTNGSNSGSGGEGGSGPGTLTRYLPPFQAFFVKATGSSPSIGGIDSGDKAVGQSGGAELLSQPAAGARTAESADSTSESASRASESRPARVSLRLRPSGADDPSAGETTAFRFGPGARAGKDAYDAYQLMPLSQSYALVASAMDGTDALFDHQYRPQAARADTVDLALKVTRSGSYTLGASTLRGFSDDRRVVLENVDTGARTDLTAGQVATFTYAPDAQASGAARSKARSSSSKSIRARLQNGAPTVARTGSTPDGAAQRAGASASGAATEDGLPDYRLIVGPAEPLPVEMASFDGSVADGEVRLSWSTASERNNAGFRVQRSTPETESWTTLGFVDGHGTTAEAQRYRFTDADLPYQGRTFTYRLKQVDTDGQARFSDPITVERSTPEAVRLRSVFPNPARSQATVRYTLPEKASVRVALYDVLGRRVRTLVDATQEAGRKAETVEVSSLSGGVHFLRLRAGDTVQTKKLVVVR